MWKNTLTKNHAKTIIKVWNNGLRNSSKEGLKYKNMIESPEAIFAFIKKKVKKIRKKWLKDPIFYFGVFAFAILLSIPSFLTIATTKSLSLRDFSVVAEDQLFLEPVKNIIKETPEMATLEQNSAIAIASPETISLQTLGGIIGDVEPDKTSIIEYIIEEGDTLNSLAKKFDVSISTITIENDLTSRSVLKPGQKIVILPVSGITYQVKSGDTVSAISKKYKGTADEIITFNNLKSEDDIYVGDILIIPGGVIPQTTSSSVAQIPIGSSYFICPHSACKKSQGLHWYNAIDFKGECGDAIIAAASGVIQNVRFGWNNGGGNNITILHPNGVVTYYGHVSASLVNPGQAVSQGQIIGLVGGKPGTPGAGISTGCHVHFDVRGARNPFAY